MYQHLFSVLLVGIFPVLINEGFVSLEQQVLNEVNLEPPTALLEISEEELSASGAIVMNPENGHVLYAYNHQTPRAMASLTKLMTAAVIAQEHSPNELLTIPAAAENIEGNKINLIAGQQYSVADMLSALLISSANDAAITLALFDSGSIQNFAAKMNARAESLGLSRTSFANPHGLDDPLQFSTPQDLAWLTAYIIRQPALFDRMQKEGSFIYNSEGTPTHLLHTHQLIHENKQVLAGKTGTTDEAKECLVSVVNIGGKRYVVVLLHSNDRYRDLRLIMKALNEYVI